MDRACSREQCWHWTGQQRRRRHSCGREIATGIGRQANEIEGIRGEIVEGDGEAKEEITKVGAWTERF